MFFQVMQLVSCGARLTSSSDWLLGLQSGDLVLLYLSDLTCQAWVGSIKVEQVSLSAKPGLSPGVGCHDEIMSFLQ